MRLTRPRLESRPVLKEITMQGMALEDLRSSNVKFSVKFQYEV